MSARARQPAKKQTTTNTDSRARDRDAEVKLQRQRLHDSTRELDIYIRNVISRNDMELYPPPRLRTSENVGAWWNNYVHCSWGLLCAQTNAGVTISLVTSASVWPSSVTTRVTL
jgi:hypothetical protein